MRIFFGTKLQGWILFGIWIRRRYFIGVSIVDRQEIE